MLPCKDYKLLPWILLAWESSMVMYVFQIEDGMIQQEKDLPSLEMEHTEAVLSHLIKLKDLACLLSCLLVCCLFFACSLAILCLLILIPFFTLTLSLMKTGHSGYGVLHELLFLTTTCLYFSAVLIRMKTQPLPSWILVSPRLSFLCSHSVSSNWITALSHVVYQRY